MTASVISLAMSDGALADEIGREVANQLGFRYVNDEIISRAAEKAGVSPQEVDQVEHSPSLVSRILSAMSSFSAVDPSIGLPFDPLDLDTSSPYQRLIGDVIQETAAQGKVVIGAHAAGIRLAGMPGLLRVFITASPDVRAKRLAGHEQRSVEEARKRVEKSDRERRSYLQRFYGLQQEMPTHYDLVISTDVLLPVAASQAIISTAKAMAL